MHGVSLNNVIIPVTDRRYDTTNFQSNDFVVIWVIHQDCDSVVYDLFVQPKIAVCFDTFPVLLQTENAKTRIALETIHHRDRFFNTKLRWKYVCPGSSKYSNSRQNKSRRRMSVKSCYSTGPLIPYFSYFVFFLLMASHHRGSMEHCGMYFLTQALSMVQIFNSKHNDSFRLHRLEQLIICLLRLWVTRVGFTLIVYLTIAKICLERRFNWHITGLGVSGGLSFYSALLFVKTSRSV